ncbi:MAG: T9SS type A sorting domain-containing protein [Bacteroidota bacterium]
MKALTFICLMLCCINVVAKNPYRNLTANASYDNATKAIIQKQLSPIDLHKTTSIQYRMVAWSYHLVDTVVIIDSGRYYYSGNRVSLNNSNLYTLNDVFTPNYYGLQQQTYPIEKQYIQCDSSYEWGRDNNWVYKQFEYRTYQYDANDRPTDLQRNYTDEDWMTYNANGTYDSVTTLDTFGSGNGTFLQKNRTYSIYDAQNKRIEDSVALIYGANPGIWVRYDYTYDASNNMTQRVISQWNSNNSTWGQINRWTYSYTPNNYLQSVLLELYGTQWINYQMDSFTYVGSTNNLYTFDARYQWDDNLTMWRPRMGTNAHGYHINTQGLWDTLYYYQPDTTTNSWDLLEKDFVIYDTNHLLIKTQAIAFTAGAYATAPYDSMRYYYESIGSNPTVINEPKSYHICTYPNPVTHSLSIYWQDAPIDKTIKISIVNSIGQTIRSESGPWQRSIKQVDLSLYPSGLYWLNIQDEQGKTLYSQKLSKL